MTNPELARPRVIELIPGGHYLVFTDPGVELPDEDTIEELRMIAYAQRKKETLGGPVELEAIATLAQAVATGVVTNYVWEQCEAAKEYVSRVRSRHRERKEAAEAAKQAEEAAKGALEAVQAADLPGGPEVGSTITLSATGEDGSCLQVSCRSADKRVEFRLDVGGAVIDVMIRPRPQGLAARWSGQYDASPVLPGRLSWCPSRMLAARSAPARTGADMASYDIQARIAGAPFLVFYGEVSDDSDGPMELCRPMAPGSAPGLRPQRPAAMTTRQPHWPSRRTTARAQIRPVPRVCGPVGNGWRGSWPGR